MRKIVWRIFFVGILALLLISTFGIGSNSSDIEEKAEYLVIIVIDACRQDYLDLAYMPNIQYLINNGVAYENAWVGHLISDTPTGHATIASGSFPARTGIVTFIWKDENSNLPIVPFLYQLVKNGSYAYLIKKSGVPTIPAIIKSIGGKTAAISSDKYFAAATMGGYAADYIMFSNKVNGTFVPDAVKGHEPPSAVMDDPTLKTTGIYLTPYNKVAGDEWAMNASLSIFKNTKPKAMLINLPATDEFGHVYGGIYSPNIMRKVVLNADKQIGRLINEYKKAGIFDKTVFIITADHAMLPIEPKDQINPFLTWDDRIWGHGKPGGGVGFGGGGGLAWVYDSHINQTRVKDVAEDLYNKDINGIEGVYYKEKTSFGYKYKPTIGTEQNLSAELNNAYNYLVSNFANGNSPDIYVALKENTGTQLAILPKTYGSHGGSTWNVQHIPMIISGPGVKKGEVSRFPARLADVAPTALNLMGIKNTAGMDGIVLADALKNPTDEQKKKQSELFPILTDYQKALIEKSKLDLGKAPTASFTYTPLKPVTGEKIYFKDASIPSDKPIIAWSWDFGDGAISKNQNTLHIYKKPGKYTVSLRITDRIGRTNTTTQTITVY
ncbi:MAG: alkaline phosphatase family protein [Candidatus Thermoplasmatota archaeon]